MTFMRPRLILVSLGLAALTIVSFGLQAQDEPKTSGSTQSVRDDLTNSQQQLARQFADFQDALLRLKQRLARGTPEEKRRAEVLEKVLDECKNLAINQEFTKIIQVLRLAKINNTGDLAQLKDQSSDLANRIRRILDLLQNANTDRLSQERKKLEELLKDLQKVIDAQKTVQAQTDLGKTDTTELQKNQENVTGKTSKIEKGLEKYLKEKDGKNGEAANLKGENKDGKGDGKKGEAKDAGKDRKGAESTKGEAKDAGKESQGAKGEAKSGDKGKQGSEPQSGNKAGAKSQEGSQQAGAKDNKSGAKGQEGGAKDNKSGDKGQEGSAKDSGSKAGDPGAKKEGPQGAAKSGNDKKSGGEQGKQGTPDSKAKTGEKSGADSKQAGAKSNKSGDPKSGEAKGGDAKSGDPKQGEAKSGSDSKSQGQAKDGGSPSQGQPSDQPPQAAQKSDQQQQPQQPSSGGDKSDDVAKANKKVKEAGYDQKIAEEKIAKKDNPQASKNQADAIQKLEEAKKKLERLLQQMREDELERVLAALQARCEKMLIMQQQVLAGTEDVHKAIAKNDDKKANQLNKKEALKLSDQEKVIVLEANKCSDILEAEGSAVAFPEVFQQVRQDMMHVQKRLELSDVADLTQGIERDIIDTLKEMIDALKKAQQDMKQDPGKPGKAGKSGQPGDQKLLELIQELKMVRSLQKRVNDRTQTYGRRFPGQEQANEPQVIRELRSLSERQLRIQEIVSRIAKGDNK